MYKLSILSILTLATVTACNDMTAPVHVDTVAGVYVSQNISPMVVADTLTVISTGASSEKIVKPIDGGTYAMIQHGTWRYDSGNHELTIVHGNNTEVVWLYDGRSLSSDGQTLIKINQ